jgi:hypothetical protein
MDMLMDMKYLDSGYIMGLPLLGRMLFIGFGIFLLVASPFVYRWGKKPSQDYSAYRQVYIQMFPLWAIYIIAGLLFIMVGILVS